uniref:CCR4-NOT transcription complex subunit 4 n=1 Tax=Ciona intestinalis TaxID=7719 RepID=F6S5I8_CIOIN
MPIQIQEINNSEEISDCPLCMEPLEVDDINFFPCVCGYQICRFCWHRIRTDENGLCPACRTSYPEDPAEFKPLTGSDLQKIRHEKRQKEVQRRQKLTDGRRHLANMRVLQKNLVFVIGLSQRLSDQEILKRQEYFGKYGKIVKVVINNNTAYAGTQGPSSSAYVTYSKMEEALRAIQSVNNVYIDGRTLKASLGTTKYCSTYLKNQQCHKTDCMYLHELAEDDASFTKEDMQAGKHQDFEQRLIHQLLQKDEDAGNLGSESISDLDRITLSSESIVTSTRQRRHSGSSSGSHQSSKKGGTESSQSSSSLEDSRSMIHKNDLKKLNSSPPLPLPHTQQSIPPTTIPSLQEPPNHIEDSTYNNEQSNEKFQKDFISLATEKLKLSGNGVQQYSPFQRFHQNNGITPNSNISDPFHSLPTHQPFLHNTTDTTWLSSVQQPQLQDTIPIKSSNDWEAAFGFRNIPVMTSQTPQSTKQEESGDDDLGFDPWLECNKGLADLIAKESATSKSMVGTWPTNNQIQNASQTSYFAHKTDRLINNNPFGLKSNPYSNHEFPTYNNSSNSQSYLDRNLSSSPRKLTEWQSGLRALLPTVNINFAMDNATSTVHQTIRQPHTQTQATMSSQPSMMSSQPSMMSSQSFNDVITTVYDVTTFYDVKW